MAAATKTARKRTASRRAAKTATPRAQASRTPAPTTTLADLNPNRAAIILGLKAAGGELRAPDGEALSTSAQVDAFKPHGYTRGAQSLAGLLAEFEAVGAIKRERPTPTARRITAIVLLDETKLPEPKANGNGHSSHSATGKSLSDTQRITRYLSILRDRGESGQDRWNDPAKIEAKIASLEADIKLGGLTITKEIDRRSMLAFLQKRREELAADTELPELEKYFIEHAKGWAASRRPPVPYGVFRSMGVEPKVLTEAGIAR